MHISTTRSRILTVAKRWRQQYPKADPHNLQWHENVYEKLVALDLNTATAEQVDAIIGNDTWTESDKKCDDCGKACSIWAVVGQPLDYESATACICFDCAFRAAELMQAEQEKDDGE